MHWFAIYKLKLKGIYIAGFRAINATNCIFSLLEKSHTNFCCNWFGALFCCNFDTSRQQNLHLWMGFHCISNRQSSPMYIVHSAIQSEVMVSIYTKIHWIRKLLFCFGGIENGTNEFSTNFPICVWFLKWTSASVRAWVHASQYQYQSDNCVHILPSYDLRKHFEMQ